MSPAPGGPPGRAALAHPGAGGFECLAGLYVLIVDADGPTAQLLATIVEYCGGWAATAATPDAAEHLLRYVTPHLLVIATPARGVAGVPTGVPALALTADRTEDGRARALAAGFRDVLTKPVDLREFSRTVARRARGPAADRRAPAP